jgi:hypothetical protein
MNASRIEQRLRRFLLAVSAALCLGTAAELWFAKHTEDPLQFVPFGLCALGLIAIGAAWFRPQRGTLLGLRVVMALLVAGSLLGIFEHVAGNIAFARELRPGASVGDVWLGALRGGNPILAPGILALTGILASAATYAHPALARRRAAVPPLPGEHQPTQGR